MTHPLAARWIAAAPKLLSVLRMVAGLLFLLAGTSKLFAFPVGLPPGVTVEFPSQIWIGGALEVVGGALLLLGLFTRPTAFILSGEMAVAYFQFHAPQGFCALRPLSGDGGERRRAGGARLLPLPLLLRRRRRTLEPRRAAQEGVAGTRQGHETARPRSV